MVSLNSDDRRRMNRPPRMAFWLSLALAAATCLGTGAMLASLKCAFLDRFCAGTRTAGWNRSFSGPAGIRQSVSRNQHLPDGAEPLGPYGTPFCPPLHGRRGGIVDHMVRRRGPATASSWACRLVLLLLAASCSPPPWKERRGRPLPTLRCSAPRRFTTCCGPASFTCF